MPSLYRLSTDGLILYSSNLDKQVVERVFVDHYCTLSGSMQLTLLRLTTIAKDIGMQV